MTPPCIRSIASALCVGDLPEGSVWLVSGAEAQVQLPQSWVRSLQDWSDYATSSPWIVAAPSLSPSALRKLKEAPPGLLILTGALDDTSLVASLHKEVPELPIFGPRATLKVRLDGRGALLGLDPAQLQEPMLSQKLQPRLQMAPVQDWILAGLLELAQSGQRVRGWIDTRELLEPWDELLEAPHPPLLCALYHQAPKNAAQPGDEGLHSTALAQDLSAPLGVTTVASPHNLAYLEQSWDAQPGAGSEEPPPPTGHESNPHAGWDRTRWESHFSHCARTRASTCELPVPHSPLRTMPPSVAHWVQGAQARVERWQQWPQRALELPEPFEELLDERSMEVLRAAAEQLTDHESKVVLKGWGFEVTRQAVGKSASAALSYAQKIGYPVALKAISPQLRQKSAAQCVELGVKNASALKRHYQKINDQAIETVGEEQLDGVLVSEMVPEGLDIQVRALKTRKEEWVLYAHAPNAQPQHGLTHPAWGRLPTTLAQALRFSDRVIPPAHPRREDAIESLAQELQKFALPLIELRQRLYCVELDPLRILLQDNRPPTVLDAYIEQDAHIQGL